MNFQTVYNAVEALEHDQPVTVVLKRDGTDCYEFRYGIEVVAVDVAADQASLTVRDAHQVFDEVMIDDQDQILDRFEDQIVLESEDGAIHETGLPIMEGVYTLDSDGVWISV